MKETRINVETFISKASILETFILKALRGRQQGRLSQKGKALNSGNCLEPSDHSCEEKSLTNRWSAGSISLRVTQENHSAVNFSFIQNAFIQNALIRKKLIQKKLIPKGLVPTTLIQQVLVKTAQHSQMKGKLCQ